LSLRISILSNPSLECSPCLSGLCEQNIFLLIELRSFLVRSKCVGRRAGTAGQACADCCGQQTVFFVEVLKLLQFPLNGVRRDPSLGCGSTHF